MSRYPPADFRGARDRSRSPPRFADRRASSAAIFDPRPPGPPRTASDAPRGPRTQFDDNRPPPNAGGGPGIGPRPGYSSLRDAPPLGSGDRGRSYREREFDRRDRPPSPRDRSPPRTYKDTRDFPPRDLDITRARRESRDGPPSAGSNFSDSQPPSASTVRGGSARGRGRGDFSFRGGRGGRSNLDDRELFRRERSPPPRWPAEPSRDSRDPDRRDDRRFERKEDERRPQDWPDRERDRDVDRNRREQPPPRLETKPSSESLSGANLSYQSSQGVHVNPARLALIESAATEPLARRASVQHELPRARDVRKDQLETPAYLNGRAETTANRYASGGSSPPTQAPPVPAFTLFPPPAAPSAFSSQPSQSTQASKVSQGPELPSTTSDQTVPRHEERKPDPPPQAPIAPRMPPAAPKAQLASPPPAAPKAPRALESEDFGSTGNRLQGVKSLEALQASGMASYAARADPASTMRSQANSMSPATTSALPTLVQPVSPRISQMSRFSELNAPTGPRASRLSPAQASTSPRPPAASPRSDAGSNSTVRRVSTPPPSAPSGPRNRPYSVSPKVATSVAPTAPKADRGHPVARGTDRPLLASTRGPDRLAAPSTWGAPSAPRGQPLWNQWRRPGAVPYNDKLVPAKRDVLGEEKFRSVEQSRNWEPSESSATTSTRPEAQLSRLSGDQQKSDLLDVDRQPPRRQSNMMASHSAARSFFGKPTEGENEDSAMSDTAQEVPSSSDDDESDMENDLALFNAKFERQKRQLEAQMIDLSTRHYRATTPLENLARLARISTRDLERFNEQREHEMDVDKSPILRRHHKISPARESSESGDAPDIVTPKDEDDHRVTIRSSDDSSDGVRRTRRPTPEPVNLPYLLKDGHARLSQNVAFREGLQVREESKAELLDAMEGDFQAQEETEAQAEDDFAQQYRRWREECEQLDRIKEEQEKLERQQSFEPQPQVDTPAMVPINPVYEGRRLHKFSSEYEIEQVLKQSEETARIEQERQDREARKNQADMEKEARIPDQLHEEEVARSVFVDCNRYREPESLTVVFSYQPSPDNFTENEQHIFIAAFKETPKKWGEIASLLPGRTYQDCIRHYYANKWDGRFRDHRTKKLKMGGRRGAGRGRGPRGRIGGLMADLARVEDYLSPENVNEKGRPRRAAAPTTFAEKEAEAKANLLGPSPAKKAGPGSKLEPNGDMLAEKSGKRQKRNGEKPGRKANKASQPLLAAAPQGSPGKQLLPGVHSKEDLADANLLASFHGGQQAVPHPESHLMYHQEGYIPAMPNLPDEAERSKGSGSGQAAKQGASSYWSVPEQNDFVKYIGHFGRDFAAIAAHMGTKTQTMIKNHYTRQVDGGSRPDLERAAIEADERRSRGEYMGPPPTPTPIQKRKYENPPAPAQRPLAPHAEGMEMDESGPIQRTQVPKQVSPPQYQAQPRITSSAQNPTVSAPRVAQSPLSTSATPSTSIPQANHPRPMPNPLSGRFTFLPESRSDVRPITQDMIGQTSVQENPTRSQTSQSLRNVPDAQDPQFIRNLVQEQERAFRMQRQQTQQERSEQFQRQSMMQRTPSHGSPLSQQLHHPPERKPIVEDRPASPPRGALGTSQFPRSLFGSTHFPPLNPMSQSPLTARSANNMSPPKKDEFRSNSVSGVAVTKPPMLSNTPAEPKRSNVLSLLNSEPEEPKPVKRENLPPAPPRTASPAQHSYPPAATATPLTATTAPRRDPSFGQASIPHSQLRRGSIGQQSSASTPAPQSHKHEHPTGGASSSQPSKPDWAARVLGQSSQHGPPTPTLDRDGRSFLHHRSFLGSLGQSALNPSPPPLSAGPHSRTPSLSGQSGQQQREQSRTTSAGQSAAQTLHPNPYATQPQSSYTHQHSIQAQNQSHHAHNGSHSGPFPSFHQRGMSRDEHARQSEQVRQESSGASVQRERDGQDLRWRQAREAVEAERKREDQYLTQRLQENERERERQRALQRGPPPTLQTPTYGGGAFSQSRNLDLRGQSWKESEMAMREEQERQRQQQDGDRRRQDELARQREADDRRREEQSLLYRRPPFGGGGYGVPPPPGSRR